MTRNSTFSGNLASLWFQAPLVIGLRSSAIASAAMAGRSQDLAEFSRMFQEKASAAMESAAATQDLMMRFGFAYMRTMAQSPAAPLSTKQSERLAAAAIAPYAKRVRANAKRLANHMA